MCIGNLHCTKKRNTHFNYRAMILKTFRGNATNCCYCPCYPPMLFKNHSLQKLMAIHVRSVNILCLLVKYQYSNHFLFISFSFFIYVSNFIQVSNFLRVSIFYKTDGFESLITPHNYSRSLNYFIDLIKYFFQLLFNFYVRTSFNQCWH